VIKLKELLELYWMMVKVDGGWVKVEENKVVVVDVDVVERELKVGWKVYMFRKARATLAARAQGACDLDTRVNEGSVILGKVRWYMC
jgi:hypothetical protein